MAIEMFKELNLWEQATRLAEEIHENPHDILIQKARMQEDRKDVLDAAATYEQIGDYEQAIQLLGKGGWHDKLYELVQKLDPNEKELLRKCCEYFKSSKKFELELETLKKANDIQGMITYHVDKHQWEEAFKLGEGNPNFNEQIYLPYGNWLVQQDRFEEAQEYYSKAKRPDEAMRVLRILINNAVAQNRFRLAGYYHWCLSKASSQAIPKKAIKKTWKDYLDLAMIYYAYAQVYKYVEEPFTFALPTTILNAAKFLTVKLSNIEKPLGVSKSYTYYCMAKLASQLGCFKLSKSSYEKLANLKYPQSWENNIESSTLSVRSKQNEDNEDFCPTCPLCNFKNPTFNPKSLSCINCGELFFLSAYSFEVLPIVKFIPQAGISDEECLELLKSYPEEEMSESEFSKQILLLMRPGSDYTPLIFNKNLLLNCDFYRVVIREQPSINNPIEMIKEYYLIRDEDTFIVLCESCQQMFIEEEWNYHVLQEGKCPFCRVKTSITG